MRSLLTKKNNDERRWEKSRNFSYNQTGSEREMAVPLHDPGGERWPQEAAETRQPDKLDQSGDCRGRGWRSGAVKRSYILLYINTLRFCSLKWPILIFMRMFSHTLDFLSRFA